MNPSASPSAAIQLHERVLAAVRAVRHGSPDAAFLVRRADAELRRHPGRIGTAFSHVLHRLGSGDADPAVWQDSLAWALILCGGALEEAGSHEAARAVYEVAAELRPTCAATVLHAGRAARRSGASDVALRHYRSAQALDEDGRIARLARIGEAMISPGRERRLSKEIRRAVRSGDGEAAAMGLEARALVRCEESRCASAIRDLCACALRYPDREDRARAAERVASLLTEVGDLEAAREALLLVHEIGTPDQRAAAEARLHELSAALGDALGLRRWSPPLRPAAAVGAPGMASPAKRRFPLPVVREWRDAVERAANAR